MPNTENNSRHILNTIDVLARITNIISVIIGSDNR